MDDKFDQLIKIWESDLRLICHGHYEAAVKTNAYFYRLGIPSVILSSIVGTSIFATISENPEISIRIIVGFLSIASAVLTSLQTFLKLSDRAEKHRESGAKFGFLLKEIEQLKYFPPSDIEKWSKSFRSRWDDLSIVSPTIPKKIFQKHHKLNKQQ